MEPFRIKLPALWRFVLPAMTIGVAVSAATQLLQGQRPTWPNTVPMMVFGAVLVLALYWLQPTLAGPGGLRVLNIWGFRRPVRWDEIVAVEHARYYLVMPAMRLVTAAGRSYWIPRESERLPALHALALRAGGPAHPLARALETPLHAL